MGSSHRRDIIEQLKEIGITPEIIDAFMKKKEKKDRRKARVAKFKKRLGYIFSFKWIIPNKKQKKEEPKNISGFPIIAKLDEQKTEDIKSKKKDIVKKEESPKPSDRKEEPTQDIEPFASSRKRRL